MASDTFILDWKKQKKKPEMKLLEEMFYNKNAKQKTKPIKKN